MMVKLIFLCLSCASGLYAQPITFEGLAVFETYVEAPGLDRQIAASLSIQMNHRVEIIGRGNRALFQYRGGPQNGLRMLREGNRVSYIVDAERTIYRQPEAAPVQASSINLQATGDTATIVGYTCQRYTGTVVMQGKPRLLEVWAAPDLHLAASGIGNNETSRQTIGAQVKGVPLRSILTVQENGTTFRITNQCVDLHARTVTDAELALPVTYTIRTGLPAQLQELNR